MDEKGALVEELIIEHNLIVLNQPNNPPTFMNANGQSNIDIKDWKVDRCCAITTRLSQNCKGTLKTIKSGT